MSDIQDEMLARQINRIEETLRILYTIEGMTTQAVADILQSSHDKIATEVEEPGGK